MFRALGRTVSQMLDPALFGVLLTSLIAASLLLATLWFGIAELVGRLNLSAVGWLNWIERILVGAGAIFLTAALFGTIAAAIAGLFVERVARAVERRWYPGLPAARPQGLGEQISAGFSFLLTAIATNLLALPLYLIWGANVPIFLGVNGYLLGRQYFELVAARRLDYRQSRALWRARRWELLLAGGMIAGLSVLPLADLLTPVVATAFMLHIVYGFREFKDSCGAERFGVTPASPFHRP